MPSFADMRYSRRAQRRLVLAVALLAAWPLLAWPAARALMVSAELADSDALVVLSGSSTYIERTEWAAQLFKEGRAPKIILTNDGQRSGWSQEQQRNPFFVERAVESLQRARVPPERIEVLPQPVSSTYEEGLLLREYATRHGLGSLLVVTSAYHSRRARWTFAHVFRDSPTQVRVAFVAPGQQTPTPASWWLRAAGWKMVALEYPKLAYYWLRFRGAG